MALLFKQLFSKREQPPTGQPPSLPQYDEDYIIYCVEQEQTINHLESAIHISDNPERIAMQTLKNFMRQIWYASLNLIWIWALRPWLVVQYRSESESALADV